MPMPSFRAEYANPLWRRAMRGMLLAGVGCVFAACSLFDTPFDHALSLSDGVAGTPDQRIGDVKRPISSDHALARPEPKPEPASSPAALPSLADLVGGAPADVYAALGEPRLRERSHAVERWHYANADCAVDFVFFFDVAGDRYRLAMIASDGQTVDVDSATRCLAGPSVAMVRS